MAMKYRDKRCACQGLLKIPYRDRLGFVPMQKGDFIETEANEEAGRVMRRIRLALAENTRRRIVSQAEFGALLARALGTEPIAQSTISEWEGGKAGVPAAVLIAATRVASERLGRPATDELLSALNRSYLLPCIPVSGIAA
jgi:hypothetical protein